MANVSDMTQLLSYTTLTLNFLFARLKKKLCERFADYKKLTANLLATPAVPQAFNACVVDTAMNHLIAPQVIQFWEEKVRPSKWTMLAKLCRRFDAKDSLSSHRFTACGNFLLLLRVLSSSCLLT